MSLATVDIHSPVAIVNALLERAVAAKASDIHVEPGEHALCIRMRVDGMLVHNSMLPATIQHQVCSRIKVLAHLDTAEYRVPQDGKFSIHINQKPYDIRVSTFPVLWGQKIVLRVLDRSTYHYSLEKLGFSQSQYERVYDMLKIPSGLILVCGPTGSGKTTLLYSMLKTLNAPEKHIITLEDPIEYVLDGITQGHINTEVGFTFQEGIRCLLRHDPDIIMVGEIRDPETARISLQAALTGHLVLSTVHAHNVFLVIARLLDMGLEPYLLTGALQGVIATHLVRTLCICRKLVSISPYMSYVANKYDVKIEHEYEPIGCAECNHTGYKGRTGIFDILSQENNLTHYIHNYNGRSAESSNNNLPYKNLFIHAISKINQGITSSQEVIRILGMFE